MAFLEIVEFNPILTWANVKADKMINFLIQSCQPVHPCSTTSSSDHLDFPKNKNGQFQKWKDGLFHLKNSAGLRMYMYNFYTLIWLFFYLTNNIGIGNRREGIFMYLCD